MVLEQKSSIQTKTFLVLLTLQSNNPNKIFFLNQIFSKLVTWPHNIQHSGVICDTQRSGLKCDTQRSGLKCDTQHSGLICDTQYLVLLCRVSLGLVPWHQ
jgi:hypothetical protein